MRSSKNVGRTVGILLLLQLAAGLMIPFILLLPLVSGSPEFLTAATEHSFQIRTAVFIFFIGGAVTLSLGITMLPVIRKHSSATALWFLAVCLISFTLDVIHNATVLSMLSFSQHYVSGGAVDTRGYEIVGAAVALARRSAHVVQLVTIGAWIFTFYITLFRFALIPRVLALLGLIGIVSQFIGVTLMMLLGYSTIGQMAMPMLPIQITIAFWLIIKGFNEPFSEAAADLK